MTYWKGLLIAVVFDAGLVAGGRFLATEPPLPARSQAIAWPAPVADMQAVDRRVDSLMLYLHGHPRDVAAMQRLARLYVDQGWHEEAIGPLARALQLDPYRRGLWVALDRVLQQSGRATITDAQLSRAAQAFVESIEMLGHGC